MNRERIALLTVAIIAVGAALWYRGQVLGEPAEGPELKLAIVTGGSGPYWQIIADGAEAAGQRFRAKIDVLKPSDEEDVQEQTKMLFDLDVEAYDGVAVSPLDAEKQTRAINQITGDAIVVTVDSDAPLSLRSTYVGSNNRAAGLKCAQMVKEALPEGGKIAVLVVNLTKDNMIERKTGFEEALANEPIDGSEPGPAIEIVDILIDEADEERSEQQLRDLLAANDDIVGLVGMNAQHGGILLRVLEDLDRLGEIKLVTFDDAEATLKGIEDGHIHATVAQDPYYYGYEAVRYLSLLCRQDSGRPLQGAQSSVSVATQIVKQNDIADFRKKRAERGTTTAPADETAAN